MKIIRIVSSLAKHKTILFKDSKGVLFLAIFEIIPNFDIAYTLYREGKLFAQTTYSEQTGRSLSYNEARCQLVADIANLKNNFSYGYIWKKYQSID